jgi:dienelactone hydrolase
MPEACTMFFKIGKFHAVSGLVLVAATCALAGSLHAQASADPGAAQRAAEWQKLDAILPAAPAFETWVQKTGAVPPDFSKLPKQNMLPEPLSFLDGHPVRSAADWAKRRAEISELSQKYVWGRVPPTPKLDHAEVIDEHHRDGYTVRNLKLIFGPGNKGTMRARVYIPDGPGPMPALINSSLVGWAPELLRRGYISAGYAGNDGMDDAAALSTLYPEYDFALLPRRAWAAALVVDYLYQLPQTNKQQIAIFGYSRDGKMATMAAALDPRITALIAGSTGVGGVLPWRDAGEVGVGEGTEATTRAFPTWFAPQLRYFTGREDRLPVDANLVAAMIAPRPLLMEWGNNDQVTSTFGMEATYYSALKVYQLLGVPQRISTIRVPGFHGANDVEADLDWLDIQFGRSKAMWTNNLIFEWNWNQWRTNSKDAVDLARFPANTTPNALTKTPHGSVDSPEAWQARAADLKASVNWMLGEAPVKIDDADRAAPFAFRGPPPNAPNPGQVKPNLPAWTISQSGNSYGWLEPQKSQTTSKRIVLGGTLAGDLYMPVGTPADKKLPVVIWLHGYSYSLGYMWAYHMDLHPILALVQAGYAVMAFDQSGFGSRMDETGPFYQRYPKWSHMGRMVEDVQSAITALSKDAQVDASRVYLYGYSIGGETALYAAALDPRVKGVVSVAGFTPMRTDTVDKGTGGVARFSTVRDFTPRVGYFIGHEQQIPFDYQDLIGLVAPRPVLVVQPSIDREATPADVHAAVTEAGKVYALYHAQEKLTLMEPQDINRLPDKTMQDTVTWMKANLP